MIRSSRLVLPLLLTLGCAPGLAVAPPTELATAAIAPTPAAPAALQAVRELLAMQVAAWNRGDLEGYMAGYWRSPQLTFFAGGAVTTGWDETLARYRRRYQGEGRAMGTLTFENLQLELLSNQAALARGRWVLSFAQSAPPATGAAPGKPAAGLFTVFLRRHPEGWRIIHDHSCSD